jgi:hypothetical protein
VPGAVLYYRLVIRAATTKPPPLGDNGILA